MESKLLLTRAEAARCLSVSESTIDRMVRAGQLRAVFIGRAVRFDPRDLQSFIDETKAAGSAPAAEGKGGLSCHCTPPAR